MEIRAYDELYLDCAQRVLGDAVDFAVMTLNVDPKDFENALRASRAAKLFSKGDPAYTAGMTGCEFARRVLEETGTGYQDSEDVMYPDKSPEYWAGWAAAYCQWRSDRSFAEIFDIASLDELIEMYPAYHEADVTRIAEELDLRSQKQGMLTRLRAYRDLSGLSQSKLAARSGVPLRQIQLFEQGQRDINKTSAETLYRLSKALSCEMEELLEK